MSGQTLSLSSGLANAAYAVGTVLAVQFAQHLPQRRMMLGYAVLLVVGSILAAAALDPGMYIAGRVIQGLCTSLLLIAAVPPLAIGYPAHKLRDTAVIMNMCIFGAVALGPFIGGLQAQAGGWRPLFWIVAAISVGALVLAALTFEDSPPANPDSPRDLPAIGLAAAGCVAAFFGASELTSHRILDPVDRSAARRPGRDHHVGRLPVPSQATALDDPHDAHEHDSGRRDRVGAVRRGRLGVCDGAHGRGADRPV
jgi:MFS family permease